MGCEIKYFFRSSSNELCFLFCFEGKITKVKAKKKNYVNKEKRSKNESVEAVPTTLNCIYSVVMARL